MRQPADRYAQLGLHLRAPLHHGADPLAVLPEHPRSAILPRGRPVRNVDQNRAAAILTQPSLGPGVTIEVAREVVERLLQPRVLEITSGHEAVSVVSDDAELGWARRCHWLHVGAANSVRDSSSSTTSVSAAFELAEVATRTDKGWQLLVFEVAK